MFNIGLNGGIVKTFIACPSPGENEPGISGPCAGEAACPCRRHPPHIRIRNSGTIALDVPMGIARRNTGKAYQIPA
jgi:hypothetical protein